MSDHSGAYKPAGWHAITPRLIVADVAGLVHFLKVVFDAEGEAIAGKPSEIRIDDTRVMVSDGGGIRKPMPSFFYVYVPDTDLAYDRAIAAGAEALEAPAQMPYGDRRAAVCGRWGNIWQIATYGARSSMTGAKE